MGLEWMPGLPNPFASSEVEMPLGLALWRWVSRLRSTRTDTGAAQILYPAPRRKALPWRASLAIGCGQWRAEEHKSELQSLMRIQYSVFCLKKQKTESNSTIPTKTKL